MKFNLLVIVMAIRAATSNAALDAVAEDDGREGRELNWKSDCGTVAYYHPVYSAGWENGYCELSITCNVPSYDTAAQCCGAAYLGQGSGACLSTAGIAPPPAPAPSGGSPSGGAFSPSGGGKWYPDYSVDWAVGMCIDTLPLPPYGSRPLYDSQLECCKAAYAGQTSQYCIKNLVNPPTASPSMAPTDKPTGSPTTDKPTRAPTTSSPSRTPTDKPTSSPSRAPTFKPTASPSTKTPTASPSTKTPTETPTSKPTRMPTDSPVTREPTAIQYAENIWYPKYGTGKCSNQLPAPVNGAAPISTSRAACCAGNFNWAIAVCLAD